MPSMTIRCKCGVDFEFTMGEQQYYKLKGFDHPKRCKSCRELKNAQPSIPQRREKDYSEPQWLRDLDSDR